MQQRDVRLLVLIVLITALAIWVSMPTNPGIHIRLGEKRFDREIRVYQGLDLRGGMQVLLEADLPSDQDIEPESMQAARTIVESRVNGLGVTEPIVQGVGSRRILVQLPGIDDPQAAVATLRETGLMEWVDTGADYLEPGTKIQTDYATSAAAGAADATPPPQKVYHTVLTGRNLRRASVEFDRNGLPVIAFELDGEGGDIFAQHTANNVGRYLAIVLDKAIISCPRIQGAIPEGRGQITGRFSVEEAKAMVLQLPLWCLARSPQSRRYPRSGTDLGTGLGPKERARRHHRSGDRAPVHADLLSYARPSGGLGARHLRPGDVGPLQADPGDADLARNRRIPLVSGHGCGCEHSHL